MPIFDNTEAFNWRYNSLNYGTINIKKSYKKNDRICLLTEEREIINAKKQRVTAVYCLDDRDLWK